MISARRMKDQMASACSAVLPLMKADDNQLVSSALAAMPAMGRARIRHLRALLRVVSGTRLYDVQGRREVQGRTTLEAEIGLGSDDSFVRQSTSLAASDAIVRRAQPGRG